MQNLLTPSKQQVSSLFWITILLSFIAFSHSGLAESSSRKGYVTIGSVLEDGELVLLHPKTLKIYRAHFLVLYALKRGSSKATPLGEYQPLERFGPQKTTVELIKKFKKYKEPKKGLQYYVVARMRRGHFSQDAQSGSLSSKKQGAQFSEAFIPSDDQLSETKKSAPDDDDWDESYDTGPTTLKKSKRRRWTKDRMLEMSRRTFFSALGGLGYYTDWDSSNSAEDQVGLTLGFSSGYGLHRKIYLGPYLMHFAKSESSVTSRLMYFGFDLGLWHLSELPLYFSLRVGVSHRSLSVEGADVSLYVIEVAPGGAMGFNIQLHPRISFGAELAGYQIIGGTDFASSADGLLASQLESNAFFTLLASVKVWH